MTHDQVGKVENDRKCVSGSRHASSGLPLIDRGVQPVLDSSRIHGTGGCRKVSRAIPLGRVVCLRDGRAEVARGRKRAGRVSVRTVSDHKVGCGGEESDDELRDLDLGHGGFESFGEGPLHGRRHVVEVHQAVDETVESRKDCP